MGSEVAAIDKFHQFLEFAETVCKSGLCPKAYVGKPADAAIAMVMGNDIGLKPLAALQSIAVINGNPSLWGDGAMAVLLASGEVEAFEERDPADALKLGAGQCAIKMRGRPHPVVRTFTIDDAKRAGLWGKPGPWTNYPGRMLQMRPRAWAMRDSGAHILKGFKIAEEIEDFAEEPERGTVNILMPKSKSGAPAPSPVASMLPPPAKVDTVTTPMAKVHPAEEPPAKATAAPKVAAAGGKVYRLQSCVEVPREGKGPYWKLVLDDRDEGKVIDANVFSKTVAANAMAMVGSDVFATIVPGGKGDQKWNNVAEIDPYVAPSEPSDDEAPL